MAITISSFFFQKMKTLRLVNLIGCLFWIEYGLMLGSTPVVLTNVAIGSTHVFWFIRNSRKEEDI